MKNIIQTTLAFTLVITLSVNAESYSVDQVKNEMLRAFLKCAEPAGNSSRALEVIESNPDVVVKLFGSILPSPTKKPETKSQLYFFSLIRQYDQIPTGQDKEDVLYIIFPPPAAECNSSSSDLLVQYMKKMEKIKSSIENEKLSFLEIVTVKSKISAPFMKYIARSIRRDDQDQLHKVAGVAKKGFISMAAKLAEKYGVE